MATIMSWAEPSPHILPFLKAWVQILVTTNISASYQLVNDINFERNWLFEPISSSHLGYQNTNFRGPAPISRGHGLLGDC